MLSKKSTEEFLQALSSKKPTPGGGSAAADAGAKAAALVSKVAKKSGNKEIAEKSERFMEVLANLINKDAEAYKEVVSAYRFSKKNQTGEEKIEKALKRAAEIPLQTARYSYEVLGLAEALLEKAKPGMISDVGTASSNARSSIESALLNVKTNLSSIKDEEFKREINKGIEKIADYFLRAEQIIKSVQTRIASNS